MFIASLWKEIILFTTFLISLFIKYGLIIIYEKIYLKYFKKENKDDTDNDDTELIPLSRIDTSEKIIRYKFYVLNLRTII